MLDIATLVESGINDFNITVKYSDLVSLGDHLVERILKEVVPVAVDNDTEKLLTKPEVMEKFGVCHTTLWNWARTGVLIPVKVGRKIHYRLSDVKKLLERRGII